MLMQQFLRIPEFQHTPKAEIQALVQRARVLCFPPGRWLLRQGRQLDAFLYLLQGSIAVGREHQVASVTGPLHHFYPGGSDIRTRTSAQVLWVDAAQHEFFSRFSSDPATIGESTDAIWLERFLSSQMMQQVRPGCWQQLIQSFVPHRYLSGELIIRKGAPGDVCFVIQQGHAVVHDGRQTLCHLGPGDFFGEDALVTGSCRNASVTALQAVVVHAIDKDVFCRLLLEQIVDFVTERADGSLLRLADNRDTGSGVMLGEIRDHIRTLDVKTTYYVGGGSRAQRALAALLMIQKGFTAYPLAAEG